MKPDPSVGWDRENDMSEAIKSVSDATFESEVLASPVAVLVDYWAEWCGPCKMVAPVLDESAKAYAGRLSIAKINIDENPKTPSRYHVRGIPTLMLFKDGQPVATQVGAVSRAQLSAFIEANL
jgi:thioredoxin 1